MMYRMRNFLMRRGVPADLIEDALQAATLAVLERRAKGRATAGHGIRAALQVVAEESRYISLEGDLLDEAETCVPERQSASTLLSKLTPRLGVVVKTVVLDDETLVLGGRRIGVCGTRAKALVDRGLMKLRVALEREAAFRRRYPHRRHKG